MSLIFQKFESEEQYKKFVEQFYYLVDGELKKSEKLQEENDHRNIAFTIPKIISLINTIGYLRGEDGVFVDSRPHGLSFQNELYGKEQEFEERLYKLIKYVRSSPSADFCKARLEEYFFKNRNF